ncbi:MAG: WD40/YVTN/BNR-like repeat-containing protein [bacterium]
MRMCSALIFLFLIQILFCFSGYADEIHNEAKKRLSVSVSNKKKDNPVLVVALNFLFTPQVVAQDFWDTIGPFGGTVYSLAINADGHIFAGTNGGGIFRSTDNSESWTEVATLSAGFSTGHIRSLATSPNGDIFAGFESLFDAGRVFRSIDNTRSYFNH